MNSRGGKERCTVFLYPFSPFLLSFRAARIGTGKFRSFALNVTLCKSNRLAEIYLHGVIIWWYHLFDHTKVDRDSPSRFLSVYPKCEKETQFGRLNTFRPDVLNKTKKIHKLN